jgi:hypothetical protein
MNVAIHQPQYLPWLPYLLKIEECDVFIILDTVDFQKNGLQNRNQIKTAQGAHWLTVPVRQQLGQKILDVKIDNSTEWRRKHWQTLQQCYRKAPAFAMYAQELDQFYSREWIGLNELNIELLAMLMRWMDIRTPMLRSSQIEATGAASELVLNLCLETGATRYLSGTGGKNYLEPEAFESAGVEIVYRPSVLPENYPQLYPRVGFINHLSVLDLLLNCGEAWRGYLPAEVATT